MKKITSLMLFTLLFLFSTIKTMSQEYCTPQFDTWYGLTCSDYKLISVNIGDISNDASNADCLNSDYLSLSTTHQAGETIDFSITLGNWMSFAIYSDFNTDGDFSDDGEMLFAGNPAWEAAVEQVSDNFDIPANVLSGEYRMRVVAIWGNDADNPTIGEGQACETFYREGSGNFHDYTLIIDNPIIVDGVTISTLNGVPATITEEMGTLQLEATVTPVNAVQDVVWSVASGSEYASVDQTGLVSSIANGTVTIRATSVDEESVYGEIIILIDIEIAVESVVITIENNEEPTINVGEELQLIATISPDDALQGVVWYITSGSEFASVDESGLVTALSAGVVKIRATSTENAEAYDDIEIEILNPTASITSPTPATVTIYPNPTEGLVYFDYSEDLAQVEVYNLMGQKVNSSTAKQIDLSDFDSGLYLIKIVSVKGYTSHFTILKK